MQLVKLKGWFVGVLLLMCENCVEAQTFHALLLADTDGNSGAFAQVDLLNVSNAIAEIQAVTDNLDFNYYIYPGNSHYIEAKLDSFVQNLKSKPDDVLFVYYSGCTGKLGDIEDKIKGLEFRLVVTVIENHRKSIELFRTKKLFNEGVTEVDEQMARFYKKLFHNQKGHIYLINGQNDESTYFSDSGDGGCLTYSFFSVLQQLQFQQADWKQIVEKTVASVHKLTRNKMHPIVQIDFEEQHSVIKPDSNQMQELREEIVEQPEQPDLQQEIKLNLLIDEELRTRLLALIDEKIDLNTRLNDVDQIVSTYFKDGNAIVEKMGRNNTTVVSTIAVRDYLEQICFDSTLIANINLLSIEKDENNKISLIRVYEFNKK